jgi:hypothetical protein
MSVALWPCRAWLGPVALLAEVVLGFVTYAVALSLLDLGFGRGRLIRLLRWPGVGRSGVGG